MSSPNNNTPTPSGDGLSILDLENLPKPQYRVMRVVMRERECTHTRLIALLAQEEMPAEEFEKALAELLQQQWLVKVGEHYKANLRRKNARVLSEFQPPRRSAPSLRGIWDSLEKDDKK
jgi:hypothetical protein